MTSFRQTAFLQTVFVALAALEFETLVGFYRDLLGQEPVLHQNDRYAEFVLPGFRLALFKPQASDRDEFSSPQGAALSLCLEVDNLESALDRLAALGYPAPEAIATSSHGREVYASDPAGNRLIFYEPKPLRP
jgi:catechol 2,3-dioxygenase-like lactoylglutathione lyase family enzyme